MKSLWRVQILWFFLLVSKKLDYSVLNFHSTKHYQWINYSSYLKDLLTITQLTHWGQVTQICIDNKTIIGSDNGLLPCQHQAIIWTNAGILLIGPLGTNFNEISTRTHTFSFKKINFKMSVKWQPFSLGLNVLMICAYSHSYTQVVFSCYLETKCNMNQQFKIIQKHITRSLF